LSIERKTIDRWIESARKAGIIAGGEFQAAAAAAGSAAAAELLYYDSVKRKEGSVFALLKMQGVSRIGPAYSWDRVLGIFGRSEAFAGFEGEVVKLGDRAAALFADLSHANASGLRRALPFTAPSPLADRAITFGAGDRLGVAGPGHLRSMSGCKACPVLAQQSVRELELTGRDYRQVLDAATWAVFQEGYEQPWGADGDHLKSEDWVRKALQIGFTRITADVSDYISGEYADGSDAEVAEAYEQLEAGYRRRIEEAYLPLRSEPDAGRPISFSRETLARTALIYGRGIEHALRLYRAGVEVKEEGGFDFELSVDETETPTTPEAHVFVAMEAKQLGMKIGSLAPRFVGEFQKGIDYIGDLQEFERTFAVHAALAREFGHRISVHSGSDKFSVFPAVGELSRGRYHIKTAGTFWLEAMKIIAAHEPQLYRRLHRAALERFDKATVYYVVTTDLENVPQLDALKDGQLPSLFDNPDARQLIHITYGELLRDRELGRGFYEALNDHIEEYWQAVQRHTDRHLKTLGVK
jgi:tagaturonate epimerase